MEKYESLYRIIIHSECYNCIRRKNGFVYCMGNCPTISHMFLALSTQWVSSPLSRKYRHGVSPRFHRIVWCEERELGRLGGGGQDQSVAAKPSVKVNGV